MSVIGLSIKEKAMNKKLVAYILLGVFALAFVIPVSAIDLGKFRKLQVTLIQNEIGLTIRGVSGQSANLIECQDSTGSAVFSVSAAGAVSMAAATALSVDKITMGSATDDCGIDRYSAGAVQITNGSTGFGNLYVGNITGGTSGDLRVTPDVAASGTAYAFDTSVTNTSGKLISVLNNTSEKAYLDYLGDWYANGFYNGTLATPKTITLTDNYIPVVSNVLSVANPASGYTLAGGYFKAAATTLDQTNTQLVGVLARATMGQNVTDVYGVQSYVSLSDDAQSTGNMTAVSGKAMLYDDNTAGIVSGGLFTLEGYVSTGHAALPRAPNTAYGVWIDAVDTSCAAGLEIQANGAASASAMTAAIDIDKAGSGTITYDLDLQNGETVTNSTDGTVAISGVTQAGLRQTVAATTINTDGSETLDATMSGQTFIATKSDGATTFTIPTATAATVGVMYYLIQTAAQDLVVTGTTADQIVSDGEASADYVTISTASHQIGAGMIVIGIQTGASTYMWYVGGLNPESVLTPTDGA